jgi:hypothetical protein
MSTLISKGTFRLCALLGILIISTAGCRGKSESADWQTRLVGKDGPISKGGKDSTIMMGTPRNRDGGVAVSVIDTLRKELELRIIAVDKEGKTHLGALSIEMASDKGHRFTKAVFPGFTLEDIREFQFQTRPCQETASYAAGK